MGISTSNIPTTPTGGFVQKGLKPGNVKCALRSVKLEKQEFVKERDEYMLMLQLETEPIPNFTGFDIVFGDPTKGQYKGQTGRVKASSFNYYDGVNTFNYPVTVEESMLGFLKELCTELGCANWLDAQNNKHETIQQFVEAFDKEKPFANIFINYCIGGRCYQNAKGYDAYDLNLVRGGDGFKGFCGDAALVVKFDATKHIRKQKPKELENGFDAKEGVKVQTVNETHTSAVQEDFKAQQAGLPVKEEDNDLPFKLD